MGSVAVARWLMTFPEKAGPEALFITFGQAVYFCRCKGKALGKVYWFTAAV